MGAASAFKQHPDLGAVCALRAVVAGLFGAASGCWSGAGQLGCYSGVLVLFIAPKMLCCKMALVIGVLIPEIWQV